MAWGITDTEDTQTYTVFFSAIKKRVPDVDINILMTDDGEYKYFWIILIKYF